LRRGFAALATPANVGDVQRAALTELLELYAALYEVFPTRTQMIELPERFGLSQKVNARADQLSGGQQQRLAQALAVINNPQIVLLDEPTTGLDPQAWRGVWAIIRRMQAEGRTVLLTTHSFVSNLFLPIEQLPSWPIRISQWTPATMLVDLIRPALVGLASYGFASLYLAARLFRWEPKN
jgi:hypothetical protein